MRTIRLFISVFKENCLRKVYSFVTLKNTGGRNRGFVLDYIGMGEKSPCNHEMNYYTAYNYLYAGG